MSDFSVLFLEPDRFLPVEKNTRDLARELYASVKDAPIVSPHGHTDPKWFATNKNFENATDFLIVPDHYILRMLYSQGISLEDIGAPQKGKSSDTSPREAWRIFSKHYFLFRGTPSRIWMDYVFFEIFGIDKCLDENSADYYFEKITSALQTDDFRPRSLLDRFNVEFIATTEGALDNLEHHAKLIKDGWGSRVVTTFRPDDVLDASRVDFKQNVLLLGELTSEDTQSWDGYLQALRKRRLFFKEHGATATDHGHPSSVTADLNRRECEILFAKCLTKEADTTEQELFRGQMLTEMAGMSLDDGLVMQLHPGVYRNHNQTLFEQFGPDKGADIPLSANFVEGLYPLLNKYGTAPDFNFIIFTLDETTYARELAPLAGHYPCLKLGPPWWFNDSPEGMLRFRRQVTETAGFYNTAGFNDDTRALLSIPARHDLARRMDAHFLSTLVSEQRLNAAEAMDVMKDLTVNLVKRAYKLSVNE